MYKYRLGNPIVINFMISTKQFPFPPTSRITSFHPKRKFPRKSGLSDAVKTTSVGCEGIVQNRIASGNFLRLRRREKIILKRAIGHVGVNQTGTNEKCAGKPVNEPGKKATPDTALYVFHFQSGDRHAVHCWRKRTDWPRAEKWHFTCPLCDRGKEILPSASGCPTSRAWRSCRKLSGRDLFDFEKTLGCCVTPAEFTPGKSVAYHALTYGYILAHYWKSDRPGFARSSGQYFKKPSAKVFNYGINAANREPAVNSFTACQCLFWWTFSVKKRRGKMGGIYRNQQWPALLATKIPRQPGSHRRWNVHFFSDAFRPRHFRRQAHLPVRNVDAAVAPAWPQFRPHHLPAHALQQGMMLAATLRPLRPPDQGTSATGASSILFAGHPKREISVALLTSGKPF